MAVVLDILLIALAVVLGLVALLLVTPFQVRIRGSRYTGLGEIGGYAGVPLRILGVGAAVSEPSSRYGIYLFGIPVWRRPIPFEKLVTRRPASEAKAPKQVVDPAKPSKARRRGARGLGDGLYLFRTPHARAVLGRLFRLLNPRGEMNIEVGFDDPSATGALAGVIALLEELVPGLRPTVRYNFTDAVLEGRFSLGATLWIPQLIAGAAAIALSKEGRALIGHLWGFRKRKPAQAVTD
jgi:hypothetical protein